MKNKHKSLFLVIAIACAVGVPLSLTTAHELPVQAALTAPTDWDFKYTNEDFPGYKIRSTTDVITIPNYTRTTSGSYYDYTNTSTIITGLEITQTFNRSTTSWYLNGITDDDFIPSSSSIGSDSTVGTLEKNILTIVNDTPYDYRFYLDISSSPSDRSYTMYYNLEPFGHYYDNHTIISWDFNTFYVPAFNTTILTSENSSRALYFDAWYLQNLGYNSAYDAAYNEGYDDGSTDGYNNGYEVGYDAGEDIGYSAGLANNPNILINAAESLIGIFVNFTFILFTLEMFGVSILSIVGVLFGLITIVWILKTIRG
jgi:hypothetical protein